MTETGMGFVNPGATEHPHRQIAAVLRGKIRRGDWACSLLRSSRQGVSAVNAEDVGHNEGQVL